MASRKGRVRPPVDSAVGAEGSGGRALDSNSFFTGQELYQEPGKQVRAARARPRQFRASLGEIAAFTRDSLELVDQDGLSIQLSQIQTVRLYAKNDSGGTLTCGQAVYVSGANGTNILITKAKADTEATSSKTLGLVEDASVASNGFCWVVTEGLLSNVNTGSYTAGNALWLSPSTAGGITTTKPSAPDHMVFIGYVVRANANVGEIYVKPQNGFELKEIHDVQITTTPSDGQVLAYEAATALWKPTTVSGSGGSVSSSSTTVADNSVVRFDGTGGTVIQTSVVTIDDTTGNINGPNDINAKNNVTSANINVRSTTYDAPHKLYLFENARYGSEYVSIQAPDSVSTSKLWIVPSSDGSSGQVFKTNGSGTISVGDVDVANVSGLGTGVATFLATPSSANLASAVTDETGSGKLVFADTTTAPTADKVLKWNGSTWVPGSLTNTTEFQFLVTSFTVSPSVLQEIGSGVWKAAGALSFTAAYQNNSGMTAASIQISGTGVTAWTSALSLSSPYTSGTSAQATNYPTPSSGSYRSITFTITATRGSETPTRTATVLFGNNRFWGVSTTASGYTEAIVEGLANSELTTSRAKTSFTTTAAAGTGNYVIYATPSLLGTATFVDNTTGFAFSMIAPESVTVTNPSGYSETYYVYRSTYPNLGAVDVKVS